MKTTNKYFIALREHLKFVSSKKITLYLVNPICLIIVLAYLLYQHLIAEDGIIKITISSFCLFWGQLLTYYIINAIVFTLDYPYSILRKKNNLQELNRKLEEYRIEHKKNTDRRIQQTKELFRKQYYKEYEQIINERQQIANERQEILNERQNIVNQQIQISNIRQEIANEYQMKFNKETNDYKNRIVDELYTDDYKTFLKAQNKYLEAFNQIIKEHAEIIRIATEYTIIEFEYLNLNGEEALFLKNTINTFVDTGIYDTKIKSPITNRYKKQKGLLPVATIYDLGHFTRNLSLFIKRNQADVAKLLAYIFNCSDQEQNIPKYATRESDDDHIPLRDDIKAFVNAYTKTISEGI